MFRSKNCYVIILDKSSPDKEKIDAQNVQSELQKLKQDHEEEIAKIQKQSEEYKNTLQRLQADFENFRKRLDKEKDEFSAFASVKTIESFLPLMDSLGEGLKEAEKNKNEQMKHGFEKIRNQLKQILEREGVFEINSIGKKFDTYMHECLMTANEAQKEDNIVLEEFAKGYTINGRVLRPAKVKVNKKE